MKHPRSCVDVATETMQLEELPQHIELALVTVSFMRKADLNDMCFVSVLSYATQQRSRPPWPSSNRDTTQHGLLVNEYQVLTLPSNGVFALCISPPDLPQKDHQTNVQRQ